MTGQGAGLDGAALDAAAVEGSKVGHIVVGRLADFDGGQGVEAAASRATGAALLLQEGQGQAAASSGRTRSAARPDSYCAHCGRRMSPGRHGRRRYCSNGCRQSAYKRRRRVEAAALTVEG